MADVEITFEGDDSPLRGVIGRLSKDIQTFAKRAEAAFGSVQDQLRQLGRSGSASEDTLKRQAQQLERLQKASRIQTPRTGFGFNENQIKRIQAGLAQSTREARELSDSTQEGVAFLRQQVSQYDRVLQRQREINALADQRLGRSRRLEIEAAPQSATGPTNAVGFTEEQVRQIQAALARSVQEARELTQEFVKQNAGVSDSTELVRRQGQELEKLKTTGSEIVAVTKSNSKEIVLASDHQKRQNQFQLKNLDYLRQQVSQLNAFKEPLVTIETRSQRIRRAFRELAGNDMPALRYALYDVSNTLRNISLGAFATGIVPVGLSVQYEREFANVIRTNELVGENTEQLKNQIREDLRAIAQLTPISWEDVTNIATLAGQLGIAADTIGSFTETVAKFSATTDLTVDAAATAFGRLNQLIDGVDGKFENLGSAILAVGVDSVATESQIVNVSTQIASMGNLAGLTAPEIVGLSGAIASLGIRPELARGNITRLFTRIGAAATEGGFKVQEFGRLTGRTADEFVEAWGTDPGQVLQDFFRGINEEGPEAERTLRSLGITSVRDIPAILRLAQNNEEVARLIALSNEEYLQANKVSEQYGIISGTTAEQLARLGQNFQTLGATIGDSVGPLALLIQFLNNTVQGFTKLAQTGVGQFFSGLVIVLGLLVGAITAVGAVLAGLIAGMIAVKFASRELGITINRDTIRALMGGKAAIDALGISSARAATAIRVLSFALRTIGIIGAVLGVVTAIAAAFGAWGDDVEKTEGQINRFYGGLEGLTAAIEKDTAAFDENTGKMKDGSEAIATFQQELKGASTELTDAQGRASEFADELKVIEENAEDADDALRTLAAGDETLDLVKLKFLEQSDIIEAFGDPGVQQAFLDAGGDINELLKAGIEGNAGPLLDGLIANLKAEGNAINAQMTVIVDQLADAQNMPADEEARLRAELADLQAQQEANNETIKILDGTTREFLDTTGEGIQQYADATEGAGFFTDQMGELADATILADDALKAINNTLFAQADYTAGVEKAFGNYAKALNEGADNANEAAGAIGGVVKAILEEPDQDSTVILANLAVLLQFLQAQGPQTAAAQALVEAAIREVGAAAGEEAPRVAAFAAAESSLGTIDIAGLSAIFSESMEEIGSSASGAAGEVKSLADEFNELIDSIFDPINAAQEQAEAIFDLGEAYGEVGKSALYGSDEMESAIRSITDAAESPEQAIGNLQVLFQYLARTVGSETDPSLQVLRRTIELMSKQFGIAAEQATQFANINLDNFKKGVESVQEEVRTLLDYGGDLDKVVSRAFDIRYADLLQVDRIAGSWEDIADEIEQANESLEELYATQKDLAADRAIKEYFLSIAEAYGDDLRADTLRNEIEEINKQQEEAANELRQQELIAGTEILGDNEVARQNRGALLDLVREYQDYIVILAESGASQDELRRESQRLKAEFIEQATELGFAEEKVLEYAEAFDDLTFAIDNVPRDVTIEADVNPALTALRELQAQQQRNIDKANELNNALGQAPSSRPSGSGGETETQKDRLESSLEDIDAQLDSLRNRINALQSSYNSAPSYAKASIAQSLRSAQSQYQSYVTAKRETLRALSQLYTGGFTGRGGKYDPAGIVHRGEYVVPKNMVDQSRGLPNAQFLAQMQAMQGYQMGGFVGGGAGASFPDAMMVELSPYDRQLLENAGNVQLRLDGRVIAQATNRNNVSAAQRGSN